MRSEQDVTQTIEEYADMVLRLCTVYLKNEADCEDIFQTVFLRYTMSPVVFTDTEHKKAWLIRVTINACKDLLKSFFHSKTVSLEVLADRFTEIPPEQLAVIEAVQRLPRQYRELVYLHFYEGYTAPEIGQILRKNPNTVYTQIRKAKEILKEALIDV